jgi:hypothetical protein
LLIVIQPPPGYKRPPPFRQGDIRHFPLSRSEHFKLSAHPIVTLIFFFNTKNA